MSNTQNRRVNIFYNNKLLGKTPADLRKEYYKLNNEIKHMDTSSKEYQKTAARMSRLDARLKKHGQEVRGVNHAWRQTKSVMLGVIGAASGLMIFNRVLSFFPEMIRNNADLSDSYANVMKTTNLTLEETKVLSREFKGFNTRTPRKELLELAKVAGRMNIVGSRNIREFVREADQINVALGEDLGQDAVLSIAKIAAAFDVSMLQVGSAMNEIGNNSRAQEQYLVDFTARLQGAAKAAKIGAADIIAYAGVLDSMGLKVEMSGTALSTFFIEFVKDTEKFEKAAGMAEGSLRKLIGEKGTNEGFLGWMEALKDSSPTQAEFLKKLDDVGVSGARKSQVFLTLSENMEEYRRQQKVATKGLEEGISVTNEFNIRNETLAATLAKLGRKMYEAFANSRLMSGIDSVSRSLLKMVTPKVSEEMDKQRIAMRRLEFQIYDTNTPAKKRVELIRQVKAEYPDLLSHIDAETVSNGELQKALMKVNESMMLRIRIQKRMEKAEKVAESAANVADRADRIKMQIQEMMMQVQDKGGSLDIKINPDAKNFEEQVKDMVKQIDDANILESITSSSMATWTRQGLIDIHNLKKQMGGALTVYEMHQMTVNKLLDDEKEIQEEINRLKDQGIDKDKANALAMFKKWNALEAAKKQAEEGGSSAAAELSEKEKKKIEKLGKEALDAYQKLMESVQAKSDEIFYQSLPQTDQALIAMNAHYDKLREQAEEALGANSSNPAISKDVRAKREKEILDQIKTINHTHDKEMDAYYDKVAEERTQKRQELQEEIRLMSESEMDQEIIRLMQQFDEKAALYEEYGLDTTELTRNIEAAIFKIREDYRQKDLDAEAEARRIKKEIAIRSLHDAEALMDGYGQALQGFAELQSSILQDESVNQKGFTEYMIALQTAIAIASGVAKAMQASSPYEAIAIALGMAGTIATAMAQANNLNKSNPVPQYWTGTSSSQSGPAWVNEEGPEKIELPAGARIHTASRTAEMANYFAKPTRTFNTESYKSSLGGASTSSVGASFAAPSPTQADNSELIAEMRAMRKAMESAKDKPAKIEFYQKDYDRFQSRSKAIKFVSSVHRSVNN